MRLAVRVGALLVVVGVVSSACDRSPGAEGPDVEATGRAADDGEATRRAGGSKTPRPRGLLTVAIGELSTLDPMRLDDPAAQLVARQLYEGLTRWDPVTQKVVPAAAKSWRVLNKGHRFVFALRPGMRFHNGAPVTSRSFRFAFDRIARKRNASDLAYLLRSVRGFKEVHESGRAKHLAGVKTPDRRTLIVEVARADQDFPAVLTHPALVPVPPRAVKNINDFLSRPVGNGPFRIARPWDSGGPVMLAAFREFYQPPKLAAIRFVPFRDAALSWVPFVNGDIDVAEVPADQIAAADQAFGTRGFQPLLGGYYLGLNVRSPSLEDIALRRAISRAINRRAITTTAFDGIMQPPRGIVPAGMPGFDANVCKRLCTYSPAIARRLVSKAGAKRKTITLAFDRGNGHARIARLVRRQLETVGLNVRLRSFAFPAYIRFLREERQAIYRLQWFAEYPSPEVFLSSLFASNSPENHSGFASREVDRLLRGARMAAWRARRARLYRAAERAILTKMPIVPIGSFVAHWAAHRRVRDIHLDAMGGFDAHAISVASRGG